MSIQKKLTPIILCADDYAVTRSVGMAVRVLVADRRLSAVSCLSSSPIWPEEAALLKPLRSTVDVGLHFSLTLASEGATAPRLVSLLRDSFLGRIDQEKVTRELERQLDLFEMFWGETPDFVDGHQHVHIFPGIRDCLLRCLAARYPVQRRPWLRRVNPPLIGHDAPFKAICLKSLSIGFAGAARRAGFELSNNFTGIYSLSEKADFASMMACWLRIMKSGDLLMCHPSDSEEEDPEGIGKARVGEFKYLLNDEFERLCAKEQVVLKRFRQL